MEQGRDAGSKLSTCILAAPGHRGVPFYDPEHQNRFVSPIPHTSHVCNSSDLLDSFCLNLQHRRWDHRGQDLRNHRVPVILEVEMSIDSKTVDRRSDQRAG